MPIVRTASDLQRNINEIYNVCEATGEPVYITRNGKANLVVMDATAFERRLSLQRAVYEREMRTYEALMQSEEQVRAGQTVSIDEARAARARRGVS